MAKALNIGLAGLGTVGCAVLDLLRKNKVLIEARAGRPVKVVAVSARSKGRKRAVPLTPYKFYDDPLAMLDHAGLDCIVEVIGGTGTPARKLVESSLRAGLPVITANKALLAEQGEGLSRLAARYKTPLLFEAAVGGGAPIVKTVREALSGDKIVSMAAILNGTSNYLLSRMEETGRELDDIIREAQQKGYAEADPSSDIDGFDTANKLAILSALAGGVLPKVADMPVTGIRRITPGQIQSARRKGYKIKLLALYREGACMVAPCLVPITHHLALVGGVDNALLYEMAESGSGILVGPGAGGSATAAAILADLIDLVTGRADHSFGLGPLKARKPAAKRVQLVKDPTTDLQILGRLRA